MGAISGDTEITLGSEDPVVHQLLQDDGVTPIDLTGITGLTLYMRKRPDGTLKELTGAGKVDVLDAANGKIKISQLAADFPDIATYRYKYKFDDAAGKQHWVPDGSRWEFFVVYDVI